MAKSDIDPKQAPYQSTLTKKVVKAYQAPSYIPGIKHTVEGQNATLSYSTVMKHDATRASRGDAGHEEYVGDRRDAMWANIKDRSAYDAAIAGYKRRQELRLKIPSLPDSEALNLEGQKEAVRRRMRGRAGTMLSDRERLG